MNYKKILVSIFISAVLTSNIFAQFGVSNNILKVNAVKSLDKVTPNGEFKIALQININEPWHINSNKPYDEFLIPSSLTINDTSNFIIQKIAYPKAHDIKLDFSEKPLSVWQGENYIGALVKVSNNLKPGDYKLIVTLNYQACNNSTCMPPTSAQDTLDIEIADNQAVINSINENIFNQIDLSYTPIAAQTQSNDNSISSVLASSGIFLSLLFVFLGGLALNLTPCVYPLIPITIGYFGGQSEGSTAKLTMMGILFVIGMALTYSVIGVVTALSGAVFGALLQNSFVIIFIAVIFVVLSLSMFGVYEFKLPDSWVAKAGGAKSGYYGAFFMGLTMGIVAAPCIGPFVLGLVTYVAAKADPFYGFLMFFVLAIGLGVPYLVLAIFSGKIKKLPRSGEWMDAVKHVFGFILIGMALYFLLPLLPKEISGYILPIFMVITAIYLLFIEKLAANVKGFKMFKISFSVILIAVAVYTLIPKETASIDWQHYDNKILSAGVGEKRGVIIDFYADWCIPCHELDAATFSNQKVIAEAKNFHTLKADMTKSLSPDVEALKEKYKIIGVPTVLILDSKGNEAKRITGFVNADEFYNIIKNVD